MLQEIKNLIEEKKLQIIEELRDAAQITLETYEDEGEDVSGMDLGDIVWNFVDDASYEYVEVLRWVLGDDINEDVIDEILDNEGEVQDILFGEDNYEMIKQVFGEAK